VAETADTNLADEEFWAEDYLADIALPARPDLALPFDRCLAAALARDAPVARGARVVEVGCAPAKWLVFYAERFGARVAGIEYTEHGAALSAANLRATGIDGEVRHADFFELAPTEHDLVLSLGFIEHFEDLDGAFERHVRFLAPGGLLAIGVPNYAGLLGAVQRWTDPAHLALHNLAAMDPGLYRRLADRHGLVVRTQRYLDGPDPAIVRLGRARGRLVTSPLGLLRRLRITDRMNHRLLSSYLLTVMQRPRR
jgi:SAM-dependent methyltransferase